MEERNTLIETESEFIKENLRVLQVINERLTKVYEFIAPIGLLRFIY